MSKVILSVVSATLSLYFIGGAVGNAWGQEKVSKLESTIQGNQEQPKVLYIVPWQASEGPKSLYQSIDSQLQGVFSHVDRTEFRRQLHYLEQLSNGDGKKQGK
ncbi:MAG: hypothetical protein P8Y45_05600 [Exilibacterium sp.]|jgi:hypothetical protein